MQEKSWQEKVADKLPGKVVVQQPHKESATYQGIIFGTLAASALFQVGEMLQLSNHCLPDCFNVQKRGCSSHAAM